MKKRQLFLVVTIFLLAATSVWAEPIVNVIYYQKQTLLSYHPAVSRLFRFSLWLEETGGVGPVWSEEKHYTMTNSFVKTYLGSVNPLNGVDFSQQLWVEVEMKKIDGTYVLIGQRTRLGVTPSGVVPYAIYALNGPTGPQGPPGVANGITRAVHGRIDQNGGTIFGPIWSSAQEDNGITFRHTIEFVPPLYVSEGPISCTVTPQGLYPNVLSMVDYAQSVPPAPYEHVVFVSFSTPSGRSTRTAFSLICVQ